jgi:Ni/Co efflux regulator RcnB
MNNKSIISAVMAICLSTGGSAFAQSNDHQNDHGRDEYGQHGGHGDNSGHGFQPDHRNDHVRANNDERGAGPRHDLHRGERLSGEYRSRHYVVDDWRGHRLSPPPRGYHWVQIGSDYALVAIPTGIIAQIVLG